MIKQIETTKELKMLSSYPYNDTRFAHVVTDNMLSDRYYLRESAANDVLDKLGIMGVDVNETDIRITRFDLFLDSISGNKGLGYLGEYSADMWDMYMEGNRSLKELTDTINVAYDEIMSRINEADGSKCFTDDDLLEHELENGYYDEYWYNDKTNEVMKLEIEYSKDMDMTFIFKLNNYNEREKVLNFYWGKPIEKETIAYLNK